MGVGAEVESPWFPMPDSPIRNEDLPVGILRTDLAGRCFYVSERFTELTGLTAESAVQSGWEQCVHPGDREAVLRDVASALHAKTPGQAEFRCALPDGRIRWLLIQVTPEQDLQGRRRLSLDAHRHHAHPGAARERGALQAGRKERRCRSARL
jgi:PAS domain S-box-containing protein